MTDETLWPTVQIRARNNHTPGISVDWHTVATVRKYNTAVRLRDKLSRDARLEVRIVVDGQAIREY